MKKGLKYCITLIDGEKLTGVLRCKCYSPHWGGEVYIFDEMSENPYEIPVNEVKSYKLTNQYTTQKGISH